MSGLVASFTSVMICSDVMGIYLRGGVFILSATQELTTGVTQVH